MGPEPEGRALPRQEGNDRCGQSPGKGMFLVGPVSRVIFLLAVLGSALLAVSLFVYGFTITLSSLFFAFSHFSLDIEGMKAAMAVAVELVDLFLVATVFYIIALGLYELFIAKAPLPGWLKICNLDELKEKLLGLVVIALAVLFLGESLVWPNGSGDLLVYGLANAAVISAISLYVWMKR
ncbi:MAG: YqhA family protein [Methanolinea sp.]|nr:YqhA family protein [Methanolinea sp.]